MAMILIEGVNRPGAGLGMISRDGDSAAVMVRRAAVPVRIINKPDPLTLPGAMPFYRKWLPGTSITRPNQTTGPTSQSIFDWFLHRGTPQPSIFQTIAQRVQQARQPGNTGIVPPYWNQGTAIVPFEPRQRPSSLFDTVPITGTAITTFEPRPLPGSLVDTLPRPSPAPSPSTSSMFATPTAGAGMFATPGAGPSGSSMFALQPSSMFAKVSAPNALSGTMEGLPTDQECSTGKLVAAAALAAAAWFGWKWLKKNGHKGRR